MCGGEGGMAYPPPTWNGLYNMFPRQHAPLYKRDGNNMLMCCLGERLYIDMRIIYLKILDGACMCVCEHTVLRSS